MDLRKIEHNNETYIIQSYKENDRSHIVCERTKMGFILNLETAKIEGNYSKQDAEWLKRCERINVKEVNKELQCFFMHETKPKN
jgi:hypothetical protein